MSAARVKHEVRAGVSKRRTHIDPAPSLRTAPPRPAAVCHAKTKRGVGLDFWPAGVWLRRLLVHIRDSFAMGAYQRWAVR